MPQYDGSIRINTDIEVRNAEKELKRLESSISKTASEIASLRSKMDALKDVKLPTKQYAEYEKILAGAENKLTSLYKEQEKFLDGGGKKSAPAYQKMTSEAEQLERKISGITKAMDLLERRGEAFRLGYDTDEYAQMAAQVERLNQQMQSDTERQAELQDELAEREEYLAQIKANATVSDQEIINLLERRKQLVQEIADMEAADVGIGYKEYEEAAAELSQINQEIKEYKKEISDVSERLSNMRNSAQKAFSSLFVFASKTSSGLEEEGNSAQKASQKMSSLEKSKNKTTEANKKLGKESDSTAEEILKEGNSAGFLKKILGGIIYNAKKSFNAISSGSKQSNSSLSGGLKTILKYGLGIRSLYVLFNKIRSGIQQGFKNLMDYSGDFANSIQSVKNSMSTLANQIAAAFAPIVQMFIPWLNQLISALSTAMTYVAQFIAILGGKSTFTRAKQVQDSYNKSLGKTAKAADKARGALARFDDLDVLEKKQEDTGIDDMADVMGDLFEEVPVDSKFKDWLDGILEKLKPILDYLKKLKDIFMEGFWDGLGDWEYRWEIIKNSIASIKESLKDIFTDPAVLSAADAWAQSVAYMLGSLVGSMASIGLTIAANLLGGIAKYLEQNKDRIKNYLVDMFDVWAEINNILADFFISFAYVFEAFASEAGQQLTANIIGIFVDAFMGVTELASKLTRDLLEIIILPFTENKEGFRTALEGFLEVLVEVTGTIKQGIDDTFDKLNEVYDAHFKPFFNSVSQGLSDLVNQFLNFWNGKMQPILNQIALGFDALWKSHLQPMINNFVELFGKVADFLKAFWERTVKPFISWITENVAPVIIPIIQKIWNFLVEACEGAADIISFVLEKIGEFIDWLTDHQSVIQDFVIVIGSFFAAWAAVDLATTIAGIVSALISFITTGGLAATAAGVLSGAISVLGGVIAFLTSPITLVVAAIGALIAAGVLLYKHWDEVKEAAGNLKDWIVEKWEGIVEWFSELPEKIGYALGFVVGKLAEWADDVYNFFATKIPEIIENVFTWFKELPSKIYDAIITIGEKIVEWKNAAIEFFRTNIPIIIENVVEFFKELPGRLVDIGRNVIEGLWEGIQNAKEWLGEKITEFCSGFIDGFKNALGIHSPSKKTEELGEYTIEGYINGLQTNVNTVSDIWTQIKEQTISILQSLGDWISGFGLNISDSFVATLQSIQEQFTQAWTTLYESTVETWTMIQEYFTEFWTLFIEYLIETWEEILLVFTENFEEIWLLFEEFILFLNEIFLVSWLETWTLAGEQYQTFYDLLTTLTKAIQDMLTLFMKQIETLIKTIWKNSWKNAENIFTEFKGKVQEISNAVREIVQSLFDFVMGLVAEMLAAIASVGSAAASMSFGGGFAAVGGGAAPAMASYSTQNFASLTADLPHLASGSVIRGGNPFMAILGDQPRGVTNIETPVPTMVNAFKQAVAEMGGINSNERVPVNININYDNETFMRIAIPDLLSELARQGYDVDVLGAT